MVHFMRNVKFLMEELLGVFFLCVYRYRYMVLDCGDLTYVVCFKQSAGNISAYIYRPRQHSVIMDQAQLIRVIPMTPHIDNIVDEMAIDIDPDEDYDIYHYLRH